jgi:predicted pyridoxine 5'-phosphate oxidase superfamily flavin-nucleotide-binding protein
MDKTLSNILENKSVALVCWRKMMGYQIKGVVSYVTSGQNFDEAVKWIKSILPDRVVKGLIVLTPNEIYDISPNKRHQRKNLS